MFSTFIRVSFSFFKIKVTLVGSYRTYTHVGFFFFSLTKNWYKHTAYLFFHDSQTTFDTKFDYACFCDFLWINWSFIFVEKFTDSYYLIELHIVVDFTRFFSISSYVNFYVITLCSFHLDTYLIFRVQGFDLLLKPSLCIAVVFTNTNTLNYLHILNIAGYKVKYGWPIYY